MKIIAAMFVFFGFIVGGCAVSAETDQEGNDDASTAIGEPEAEDVDEASQALDANCTERTCVSCSAGMYQSKTVKWMMVPKLGCWYKCSSNTVISVTYGACQPSCSL